MQGWLPGTMFIPTAVATTDMTVERVDVLRYVDGDEAGDRYVAVPAGDGDRILAAHEDEARKREQMRTFLKWLIIAVVLGYALVVADNVLLGAVAAVFVSVGFAAGERWADDVVPDVVARDVTREDAVAQWDAELSPSFTHE